jgi:hypothetical protein
MYVFLLKTFYKITNSFTNNLIDSVELHHSNTTVSGFNNNNLKLNVSELFTNKKHFNTNSNTSLLSKTLSTTQDKLSLMSYSLHSTNDDISLISNIKNNTIKSKSNNTLSIDTTKCITSSESKYTNITNDSNFKIKNTIINLKDLNSLKSNPKYPLFFNFNLESNLNLAKQQR